MLAFCMLTCIHFKKPSRSPTMSIIIWVPPTPFTVIFYLASLTFLNSIRLTMLIFAWLSRSTSVCKRHCVMYTASSSLFLDLTMVYMPASYPPQVLFANPVVSYLQRMLLFLLQASMKVSPSYLLSCRCCSQFLVV